LRGGKKCTVVRSWKTQTARNSNTGRKEYPNRKLPDKGGYRLSVPGKRKTTDRRNPATKVKKGRRNESA